MNLFPPLFFFIFFLLLPFSHCQNKILLKVNFAGPPTADFLSEEQVVDLSAFQKNVVRHPIQNTDTPKVFQSQRFSRDSDLTLRIPVPDGIYSLTLLFAETFRKACVPGARVFDIYLGTPVSGIGKVVEAFDVFGVAGCLSAHGKKFDGVLSKEGIVVHFKALNQHPSIAGFILEGFSRTGEFKAIARGPSPGISGRRRLLQSMEKVKATFLNGRFDWMRNGSPLMHADESSEGGEEEVLLVV